MNAGNHDTGNHSAFSDDVFDMVPPADPHALVHAIGDLMDNPTFAIQLGQKGYKRIQNQFTWKAAAEKTVACYREVIRDHHRF